MKNKIIITSIFLTLCLLIVPDLLVVNAACDPAYDCNAQGCAECGYVQGDSSCGTCTKQCCTTAGTGSCHPSCNPQCNDNITAPCSFTCSGCINPQPCEPKNNVCDSVCDKDEQGGGNGTCPSGQSREKIVVSYMKKTSGCVGAACCTTVECNRRDVCRSGPTATPVPPTATPRPPTPTPTITPTPSRTPTPTPIQPSTVVTPPQARNLSTKVARSISNQQWTCLQTESCNNNSKCSGNGNRLHRVRITSKTNGLFIPNKMTWIFECLQNAQGYRCTSGAPTVDQDIIGTSYYSALSTEYGYRFISLTDENGLSVINQQVANNPIYTTDAGTIGPFEWESTSRSTVGRIFMAVNKLDPNQVGGGGNFGQKQAVINATNNEINQVCLMFKWDPHGIVYDKQTKEILTDATVTLLVKNEDGSFTKENGDHIFGGLANPIVTDVDGKYIFHVPDGIYKLKVTKPGYFPIITEEFVEKGKIVEKNIYLEKYNLINRTMNYFKGILINL